MPNRGTQDLSLQGLVVPGHTSFRRACRAIKRRAGFTWAWGMTSFLMGELTITRERFAQRLASTRPNPSHAAPLRAEHGWGSAKANRPQLTHGSP
jgi:hypothetical protein